MQDYEEYEEYKTYEKPSEYDLVKGTNGNGVHTDEKNEINPGIALALEKECGTEMTRQF